MNRDIIDVVSEKIQKVIDSRSPAFWLIFVGALILINVWAIPLFALLYAFGIGEN